MFFEKYSSQFFRHKRFWAFLLLIVLIIVQENPSLFIHPFNNLIVQWIHNPIPPSITSPWPWQDSKLHPIVKNMPHDQEKSIKSVAEYIEKNESDPYLRIKALHDYVINRVTYDLDVLSTGIRPSQDADTVFSTKKGVCEGYARLFSALGRAIGIEVVYIEGGIRKDLAPLEVIPLTSRISDLNYDWTRHAWNAVKIEGNWQLVDTTWDDTNLPSSMDYLMPSPKIMIISHFPDESKWQLLHNPKSKNSFEKQAILTPQFFREGLEIISPTDYQTNINNVEKTALIEIKQPLSLKTIVALFSEDNKLRFWSKIIDPLTPDNKTGFSPCQSQKTNTNIIKITCQFPRKGDYSVDLISFEIEKKQTDLIGKLKFHVR